MSSPVPLAEFDPPVAAAVVAVLRRAGVPAQVADGDAAPAEEVTVIVPAERREEALATMAASMEAIRDELASARSRVRAPTSTGDHTSTSSDDDDAPRPLVFERLRTLGFLSVLLVPLLVVTLSGTRLPAVYAFALIAGGILALAAWRARRSRNNG